MPLTTWSGVGNMTLLVHRTAPHHRARSAASSVSGKRYFFSCMTIDDLRVVSMKGPRNLPTQPASAPGQSTRRRVGALLDDNHKLSVGVSRARKEVFRGHVKRQA